jgi:uncharacterized protein
MRRLLIPVLAILGLVVLGITIADKRSRTASFIPPFAPRLEVPQYYSSHDEDEDGVNDTQDLLAGARAEVRRRPTYRSAYYQEGYPPTEEGVCTDLVWRAFKDAGYDLKKLVDADIQRRTNAYHRVEGKPDPNIDFRRVPNLDVFFKKHTPSLTLEVKPGDVENLKEWQGGDLVLYGGPTFHIGIVSDRRRADGVPLLIHNAGIAREDDALLFWHEHITPIIGHYRWER